MEIYGWGCSAGAPRLGGVANGAFPAGRFEERHVGAYCTFMSSSEGGGGDVT